MAKKGGTSSKVAQWLNRRIVGNVFTSPRILDKYSTDDSVLTMRPKYVAIPESTEDLSYIIGFSNVLAKKQLHMPVVVCGSRLSTTGAPLTDYLLVSLERLNKILEIDDRQRLVRVEAGIKLGELNRILAVHGMELPIVADKDATIGGIIAENTGAIAKHISNLEVVLSNGDMIETHEFSKSRLRKLLKDNSFESTIYRKIDQLIEKRPDLMEVVREDIDNIGFKQVSLVKSRRRFDMTPIFLASEGTLGVISEAILICEYTRPAPAFLAASFEKLTDAVIFASKARLLEPTTIDIYDTDIIKEVAESGKVLKFLDKLPPASGYLVVVKVVKNKKRARNRTIKYLARAIGNAYSYSYSAADEYNYEDEINSIIENYINNLEKYSEARAPLLRDVYIPDEKLDDFTVGLAKLEKKFNFSLPLYGSMLTNTFNTRPVVNITTTAGRAKIIDFLRQYTKLIIAIGGSITKSSPEGRLKNFVLAPYQDPEITKLSEQIKHIFDPNNILNPGVKTDASPRGAIKQLRTNYNPGLMK